MRGRSGIKVALLLVFCLSIYPQFGSTADNDTQFTVQDDVTVLGEEGTLNDADAEFEGEVAVQRDIYQHAGQFAGPFAGFGRIENLLTYSQEFDNSAWTTTGATVTANQSAPDQSNTAYQLTNSGGSGGSVSQSVAGSSGTSYVFSVWLKAGDSTSATIEISDNGSTPASNSETISLSDKWKRYEVSFTSASDASNTTVKVINNGADTTSIYIWGAQLEQADHSGVYIKTEGSAVSERFGLGVNGQAYIENDVIVGDGANFDNSSSEADLYVKGNLEVDGSVWLGSTTIDGTIDMGSHNIVNLADPVNAQDGATKNYVDSQVTGAVSGTEDYIAKFTGAGSVGDSIIYEDSSGSPTKIGIGTSSPGAVLDVNGDVKVGTDLVIGNDASIGGGLSVSGATSLSSTLDVTGDVTIGGDLAVDGGDITSSASALNITPADGGSVNITDGTNTLMSISDGGTVGDMSLTGSANISGDTTIGGNLTVNGNTVLGDASSDLLTVHGRISQVDTGQSVFIGEGAGASDDLSDNENVFVGYQAGYSNTSGDYNTAMGYQALYSNTTGEYNTAIGTNSLYSNDTGWFNTAIGDSSLYSNMTGGLNTAIGYYSLYSNTTGKGNTAIGTNSLYSNTTGEGNTAIGTNSLYSNDTGWFNTAIGANSLYSNTTGETNLGLGFSAGSDITTGSYNIMVGYNVQADDNASDSQLNIGDTIKGRVLTGFDAVKYYDGTSYTKVTDEAKTTGGTAYTILADTDDYFYIGSERKFNQVHIDLDQAGAEVSLSVEYYNGSSWTTLSVTDGTNGLSQDGVISFTMPDDWSTTNIDGSTKYYIRLHTTTNPTTIPMAYSTTRGDGGSRLRIYSNEGDSVPALVVDASKHIGINNSLPSVGLTVGNGTVDNVSDEDDAYIAGNLEVDGTIYGSISGTSDLPGTASETFTVDTDNGGSEPADGAGYVIEGGSGVDVNFLYDATNDRMTLNYPLAITGGLSASGDASIGGGLSVSGAVDLSSTLDVSGDVVIGSTGSNSVTINGTNVSISNNLNIDSNTLYIDASNDRVGIGTNTPSLRLSVAEGDMGIDRDRKAIMDMDDGSDSYWTYDTTDNSVKLVMDSKLVVRIRQK